MSLERVVTYPEQDSTIDFFGEIGKKISFFAGKVKDILGFGKTLTLKEKYDIGEELEKRVLNGENLGTLKRTFEAKYGGKIFEELSYNKMRKIESIAVE